MQRGPLDLPADEFGVLAARVVEEATRYLDRLDTSPVRPDSSGAETLMYFDGPPAETGQGPAVLDDLAAVARHSRGRKRTLLRLRDGLGRAGRRVG